MHQHDVVQLLGRAYKLSDGKAREKATELYYRECTFFALCLFDLSQNLDLRGCQKIFHAVSQKNNIANALLQSIAGFLTNAKTIDTNQLNMELFIHFTRTILRTLVDTLVMVFHTFS